MMSTKEPQVGLCKECHSKETCPYSSADKEQCDFTEDRRGKVRRCLLEKGHTEPHTWWRRPCMAILLMPSPSDIKRAYGWTPEDEM